MSAHCDDTNDNDRAPHETWQLQAEEVIRTAAEAGENVGRLSWAFLRINIDGYNGVLKSGRISYFLPRGEPYGWMAPEDIAEVAAHALLHPNHHAGKVYRLAAESLSLDDMAAITSKVCNFDVFSEQLTAEDFEKLALSPFAKQTMTKVTWIT
jgi:uncharacterized protein YbjT (DUF2867 family)